MDRRSFIATGSAVAGLALAPDVVAQTTASGDAALNAEFERIFQDQVAHSPELATSLGLDKGANAGAKRQLNHVDAGERTEALARTRAAQARLARYKGASLSPAARLNLEVVDYTLNARTVAPAQFGIDSVIRPYRIFQQGGDYFAVPDFLNTAHTIRTADDCEAYLARLDQFATRLHEEVVEQRAEAARGFVAPGWSIDLTLGQMRKLRAPTPENNTLVLSLTHRAGPAAFSGDWSGRAAKIVRDCIYPGLDRQIALMTELRSKTQPGDGAQRLPHGDAIYAAALEQATTTRFTPDEVHRMGLAQVAELSARLDTILKARGMTKGTVGARLAALNVEAGQLYANSDEGRAALLASLNAGVKAMYARLPQAFATLPNAPLEIRRVPPEIQDGASNGYYNRAALDGSRPAIYFINLKDVGDWPKYSLPTLTFHEGVPGHHLQISLAQESKDIPTIRKLGFFSAYSEGWALYAEQLAVELGSYEGDPLGQAGFLQSILFRAARLVVDTGLHSNGWSRERATDYLVATTGFARPRSQREVERYCTQIGQACSYKVGHTAWMRARDKAKATLGSRFDIKQFHEVLRDGAMPLVILERRIAERAAAVKA